MSLLLDRFVPMRNRLDTLPEYPTTDLPPFHEPNWLKPFADTTTSLSQPDRTPPTDAPLVGGLLHDKCGSCAKAVATQAPQVEVIMGRARAVHRGGLCDECNEGLNDALKMYFPEGPSYHGG